MFVNKIMLDIKYFTHLYQVNAYAMIVKKNYFLTNKFIMLGETTCQKLLYRVKQALLVF